MGLWHFVLFVLILRHVIPDTGATNYTINFLQERWITEYSPPNTPDYVNKSQDLQLKLNSVFSNSSQRYNISILNLTPDPQKTPTESSIIASVNFKPDSSLTPQQVNETLSKINAVLFVIPDTTYTTNPTSISTVPTNVVSNKPTDNAINKISENSSTFSITIFTYTKSGLDSSTSTQKTVVTSKSGLDSSMSTENTLITSKSGIDSSTPTGNTVMTSHSGPNSSISIETNSSLATTLLSTKSPNENTTTSIATNNSSLNTTSNMNALSENSTSTIMNINSSIYTTLSSVNVTGGVSGSSDNSNSSSHPTSTAATNSLLSNSTSSNESQATQPSSYMLNSTASTDNSTTLQSSTLSTTIMPTTISSTINVISTLNLTIRFGNDEWFPEYTDLSNTVTKGKVLYLTTKIATALKIEQAAVKIYSLERGSVLANTGIKSNTLNQTAINTLLQSVGASVEIPSTATSTAATSTLIPETTTDSGLPTYAVALISVFTTCIIIAIIFVATALICRYHRLKGYGRHEVEFFEMNDGWKKSARNPSFQMD